jgi:hypothetical protein
MSEPARRQLPGATLDVEVAEPIDQPGAKRIVVTIDYRARGGRSAGPVRLVAWKERGDAGAAFPEEPDQRENSAEVLPEPAVNEP